MPLAMASVSRSDDCSTEFEQRGSLNQNYDCVRGHEGVVQFSAGCRSDSGSGSPSRIIATLKRKPSRNSFLAWVAFDRKYACNISQAERQKCPLIGCEKEFENEEMMLQHVYECLPVSKGFYRCFECRHEERIGKYHTKGCKGFQQSKVRFAKVANSLRLAKKSLFSRHESKHRSQSPKLQDARQPEFDNFAFGFVYFPSELETNWLGNAAELSGEESVSELGVFDDSTFMSAEDIFERGKLSELGCGNDTITATEYYAYPEDAAAELEACSSAATSTKERYLPRRQETSTPSSQHLNNYEGQWGGPSPVNTRSLKLNTPEACYPQYQTPQPMASHEKYCGSAVDEIVSPLSPTAYSGHCLNEFISPQADSGTIHGMALTPSTFSSVSSSSTRDNSISSFDFCDSSVEGYDTSTVSFLEEFDSDLMCLEPEKIEEPSISENEICAPLSSGLDPYYFGPNNSTLGSNVVSPAHRSPSITIQPIIKATSPLPSSSSDFSPQPRKAPFKPIISWNPPRLQRCVCGFEPGGKEQNKPSNLRRHQKICKQCPGNLDPYTCTYPDCGRQYSRSDALRVHQRAKNHGGDFELHWMPMSPPLSGSDGDDFENEGWDGRPKRRRRG